MGLKSFKLFIMLSTSLLDYVIIYMVYRLMTKRPFYKVID